MGEVFAGRYELIDPLGAGGMGTVWRVHDRRLNRIVAAKVLRQSQAVDLLRFVREQSVRIEHPHVLVPLGWAGEDERVLFTMPVVAGGSLATLVGDFGALPPLLVAEVLRQVAAAVGAVHDAGLVHRDLKPANVLLEATGRGRPWCYLSDFGIAAEVDGPRLTQWGHAVGTPGYVAPEAAAGGAPSRAADLYALGQLGATLLTALEPGRRGPAWDAAGPQDQALHDLVTRLIDPDPARRPDATVVREALAAPALAWRDDAMGEVEVFDQLPALPAAWADTLTLRGGDAVDPTPRDPGVAPSSAAAVAPEVPRAGGVRPADVVVGALVLAALVVGLLLLLPRPSAPAGSVPAPGPASSAASSASSATVVPTASSAGTAAPGSVDVGAVVVSVGQACEASQVGRRDTTLTGTPVTCSRRDDGTFAWVA